MSTMMDAQRNATGMTVQVQAEAWFARLLSEDCSAADRAAFERWQTEQPGNDIAYREVERLWHRSGALHRYADIQAAMGAPVARASWRRHLRIPLAAAAALIVAVMVGQLWPDAQLSGAQRMVTHTGERRLVDLADGSQVLLDAESELQVAYGPHERRLLLRKGQAQFKVQRDPLRPFVVQAANGSVTALGTEFQVRVDGPAVTVTLLEGKVAVDVERILAASNSDVLVPGEQIRFNTRKEVWTKKPADLEVVQGWTYGDLVFKEWRLRELVAEMNRHSQTKVRIEDDALNDLLISGRFHAGDYETMLLVLESDWPVRSAVVSAREIALYRR